MKKFVIAVSAAIAACIAVPVFAGVGPAADEWDIGPVIKGRNYSVNMPRTMLETPRGPSFDFPHSTKDAGHVHYVTVPIRSLAGARRIILTYRIDADRNVRFVSQERPHEPAALSLYFQRAGDRWNKRTPHYRWYAPGNRLSFLAPGRHTVAIDLDEEWISMMGARTWEQPASFERAKEEAARVGFVFGSNTLRGHGVYATGPARFTVERFEIE
ncbi:hypothetical protein [Erythrobacter litoralis]|uniref:Uncharacterized protein n=1 Tax=Erythrobacter litoralis (strain HTCC2594) TaxID=314225 RepID=Q2N8L2_ERYLH|nr:hypothetical protein [Erythrobacter litoralis]ABC63979.1 hypothetical protein ELI_09435 [Erythrobacter litoralis HTCC2594]